MSIRTRVPSISRDIELLIADTLSPRAQSRFLADYARGELETAQEQNRAVLGRVPGHDTFVDGRSTDDLDSVKPNGRIVFEFHLLDQVISWISEQLVLNSPIRSGRYVASHVLFADDVEVEPGSLPEAEEYVFVNTQPYARKIERGLSPQAPEGVYEAIVAVAARRFGNIARITYAFRAVAGGERNPAILVTV